MSLSSGRVIRACAPLVVLALLFASLLAAASQDQQRQPPFRTAANLVRVDAYPSNDGKIIEGLTAADFEVLEDGAPQKIETFEYVSYPQSNPVEERRDPNSQREGFALAADPTYRVFVIYLDNLHVDFGGSHRMRAPLITFLNRVLGPKDLFGVLTTRQGVNDLMLGQKTDFIEQQLTEHWDWGRGARVLDDEEDLILEVCGLGGLVAARRVHEVFSDLETLMAKLAEIREERKNIVLVSNGWTLPGPANLSRGQGRPPVLAKPGVTNAGKITLGARNPGEISATMCEDMRSKYANIDFQRRIRELLDRARESNVTFYTVRPEGLAAPATAAGMDRDRAWVDSLRILSDNTDGLAIVNTNDLSGGARRIADDLAGMYLLGYYPSNAKQDGRIRRITVRLKSTRETVRARREYRAPSAEEVAAMREAVAAAAAEPSAPSAAESALAELKRLRPGAVLHSRASILGDELVLTAELTAAEVEGGRWKAGGTLQVMVSDGKGNSIAMPSGRIEPGQRAAVIRVPLKQAPGPISAAIRLRGADGAAEDGLSVDRPSGLFGAPLVYRLATPTSPRPAGSVQFRRTERMQVRWPVDGPLDRREARVLGRDGVPLELTASVTEREEDGIRFVVADLNLAPLTAGEYILEVTGSHGEATGSALLAFRVSR